MKPPESPDAQKTTFAQEFLERVESLGYAISGIVRPLECGENPPIQHATARSIAGGRRRRSECV
jgi:hypothetical protein